MGIIRSKTNLAFKPANETLMNDRSPNSATACLNDQDNLETNIAETSSGQSLSSPYLSRPSKNASEASISPSTSFQKASTGTRKDRLYIGNLHPTVDEYALLQIFQKYGRVAHLDFLFHKTGALKGRPRGYAFLEYVEKEDALKAVIELNDKPFRGRSMQVKFANQVSTDPSSSHTFPSLGNPKPDPSRATALSLLKAYSSSTRAQGTDEKIRAMERKLEQMKSGPLSTENNMAREIVGLPEKPLPSLTRAAGLSAERAHEVTTSRTHRLPIKATEAVVGRPVTEILRKTNANVVQGSSEPPKSKVDGGKFAPKASVGRKQLGIKTLQGVKMGSKR